MKTKVSIRAVCVTAGALGVSMALSGCMSSPTYGTDKTANGHLIDGLTSMANIAPQNKSTQSAYKPRPTVLLEPPEGAPLPTPQQSVATTDNPQWPESPEETRARLIAAADADTNPNDRAGPLATPAESSEQFRQFREARARQKAAYDGRQYLSDPPEEYRIPAETAPSDELGETEWKKEQRRKAAARKAKNRWWPF